MQPLVSIIIPTYNRAHIIGETLESVLAQTHPNWECIVVDDGSTDNTDKLLEFYCEKDSRIKYHHRPKDLTKGANSCRNYGFELSNGDFINWFDSDDVMLNTFMETKINSIQPCYNFLVSSGYFTTENLEITSKMIMDIKCDLYKSLVLWENHIITNSVLFRKSFLESKTLFLSKLERGQETEFFSRLFFKIPHNSYILINTPLFLYREHTLSISHLNKTYVKKYKCSESYTTIENFKRAVLLRDEKLLNTHYNQLLILYFLGLENSHYSNSKYILRNLIVEFWKINKKMSLRLSLFIFFPFVFKRRSHRIERMIRLFKFN